MTGWNGFEDGTTQVWSRFDLSGILDSFDGMPPTTVYERLLNRRGIDCERRKAVGDTMRGRRLAFRNPR